MHGVHVLCLQGFRSQFSESTLNTVRNSPGPSSLYFGFREMLITAVIRVWGHWTRLSGQGRIFSLFYRISRWAHKVLNQLLLFFYYILTSSWQRLSEEPASLKSCSFLLFSFRTQDSMKRRDWRHSLHCATWIHDLPSLGCSTASPQVHHFPHTPPCEVNSKPTQVFPTYYNWKNPAQTPNCFQPSTNSVFSSWPFCSALSITMESRLTAGEPTSSSALSMDWTAAPALTYLTTPHKLQLKENFLTKCP